MKKLLPIFLLSLGITLSAQTTPFTVSGKITRPNGDPIPSVNVYLSGGATDIDITGAPGTYLFSDIPMGIDVTVAPQKETDHLACISIRDVIVIGKHISGIALLDSPFKMIAADVNNSKSITTLDMIELQRNILGLAQGFANNTSWRFVDASYQFPNPNNPWVEEFPEIGNINSIRSDIVVDFIGIKTGDPTNCIDDDPASAFLTISASNATGAVGEQVELAVTVENFKEIIGLQFSMTWDSTVLQFEQVANLNLPGLALNGISTSPNSLAVVWTTQDLTGLDVVNGARIFSLQYKLVGNEGSSSPISFVSIPTKPEVVDRNCNPFEVNFNDGKATIIPAEQPALFEKIYGDTARNIPTKIKPFRDGIYVAGIRREMGVEHATFSKYNLYSGDLIWDFKLNEGSIFHDFEYIPESDQFLLIGATEPFQIGGIAQDNESILIKVNDNGDLMFSQRYQQTGREHFNRIIRHPDPRNPDYPYYIVGTINPAETPPFYPPPPSSTDRVFVLNINEEGVVNWAKQYDYAGTDVPDDEFHRGLFAVNRATNPPNDGDIVITGNDSPINNGILVKINGATGEVMTALKYEGGLDIYDGVELPNGQIALVGADFANSKAFMSILDADFSPIQSLRFEQIFEFREVGIDKKGILYTVGPTNFIAPNINYNVIHKVSAIGGLAPLFARYLDNGERSFINPKIAVVPRIDRIFYADGRLNNPVGFGNYDLLVGSFDLELSSECKLDFEEETNNFNIIKSEIQVTQEDFELADQGELEKDSLDYNCRDFCNETSCNAFFNWESVDCSMVQFTDQSDVGGAPIVAYAWDVNCDGSIESTLQNPLLMLGECGGSFSVCLIVYLDGGITCTYDTVINVLSDSISPIINCPGTMQVFTDPQACFYSPDFSISAEDNCDPNPEWQYELMGATTGTGIGLPTLLNLGATIVTFQVVDACGNESSCPPFSITVTDNEAPTIQCPETVAVDVLGCSAGTTITFPEAVATDNCELASLTYNSPNGSFFSCGTTIVTATAIDVAGNSSHCNFDVLVNGCQNCAKLIDGVAVCGETSGQYHFTISAQNMTTLPFESATVTVNSPEGIIIEGPNWTAPNISGIIAVNLPLPSMLNFEVTFDFPCSFGTISCTQIISIPTPCCEEVSVMDQIICSRDTQAIIPLLGDLPYLTGLGYVNWYVASDCGPFILFQQSAFPMIDLDFPAYIFGEDSIESVCVFAELFFLPGNPCSSLMTNIATITLCDPVTGIIENENPDYCSSDLPELFQPLTFSTDANPDCNYEIQWWQNGVLIEGAINDTYFPTGLIFTGEPSDCYTEHTFTARVSNLCGDGVPVSTSIRIYNENAPVGELSLDPFEAMPFCPGEDATIRYEPLCVGPDPFEWQWYISNDNVNFTPIDGSGTINNLYNTNQLSVDTWYLIKKQNGVCPEDEISLMLDFRDTPDILSFSVLQDDFCNPTQVDMELDFLPLPSDDCDYTIHWFKDGILLASETPINSPATHTYTETPLDGNYYAVLEDNCCFDTLRTEVVVIAPPMEVVMIAPCFRCNEQEITLEGLVLNPIQNANCTYQWFADGVPISSANDEILDVNEGNVTYTFQVNCDGCIKETSYFLRQCGDPLDPIIDVSSDINVLIHPNPTDGDLTVTISGFLSKRGVIQLVDQWGRSQRKEVLIPGLQDYALSLDGLPGGIYFLNVFEEGVLVWMEKIIKQ